MIDPGNEPARKGRMDRICQQCRAQVVTEAEACPACGGALAPNPLPAPESTRATHLEVDRRGIMLPPRHAVGGVITPR